MTRSRTILTALAVLPALAVPAAAHAAGATVLSKELSPSLVATGDGVKVWTTNAEGGGFTLKVQAAGGAITTPAIDTFASRPDISVGPDDNGDPAVVYTRNGDIYRLELGSGREERLARISDPRRAEYQPTISGTKIAFVRREASYYTLRVVDVRGGSGPSKLLTKINRREGRIVDPQLSGGRLAYTVVKGAGEGTKRSIHLRNLSRGTVKSIYKANSGGLNIATISRPAWSVDGRSLFWSRTNEGSGRGDRFVQYTVADGKLRYATGSRGVRSAAWIGGDEGMLVANSLGEAGCTDNVTDPPEASQCTVATTGPLSFTAGP